MRLEQAKMKYKEQEERALGDWDATKDELKQVEEEIEDEDGAAGEEMAWEATLPVHNN